VVLMYSEKVRKPGTWNGEGNYKNLKVRFVTKRWNFWFQNTGKT